MKRIFLSLILVLAFTASAIAAVPTAAPSIAILDMPVPGTEYGITLEAGTNAWTIYGRANGIIKFAFTQGGTSTEAYMTIPSGGRWDESGISNILPLRVYLSSTVTNEAEILKWK